MFPGPMERGDYLRRGYTFSSQTPSSPSGAINTGGKERGVPALLQGQDK